jgi:hypothetical protein
MGRNFNILDELRDIHAVFLTDADRRNLFFVPQNYFNELPDAIRANIFLHSISTSNPFTVPENYFDNFPILMLDKIKDSAILNILGNNNHLIYSVPENYFDNFASEVLKKIKQPNQVSVQQELEEISPFLSAIPRTNVYFVPESYFNNISKDVPSVSPPAKIISIGSRTRKWANYAAAACVAALLFGGSFLHFYKKGNAEIRSVVSSVSNEYLQKQISVLSDEEITDYLKTNSNLAVYANESADEYQQQNLDIQNMIQNMSDEEIQQYLDQHPESSSTEEGI